MKFFKSVVFVCMSFVSIHANAAYVGRFASYVTTQAVGNGVPLQIGKSDVRVVSGTDAAGYTVQITNQDSTGVPQVTTEVLSTAELDSQQQGVLFNHCTENYGTLSSVPLIVKGTSFQYCAIKSSNTEMDIGVVPFSVIKSISYGSGKTFVTTLVDYQF